MNPSSGPNYSAAYLASLSPTQLEKLLAEMKQSELQGLMGSYEFWARQSQLEPTGSWHKWLFLGGRGAGKTWSGAKVTNKRARSGRCPKILLGAATPQDARDIMIEGESGIIATAGPDFQPVYEPSKARVTWPNGARAYIRSGAEPERFRGINTYFAWLDELAAWQYPQQSWDNAMMGLRLGQRPQVMITTTPKPIHIIRDLIKDPSCVVTTDSSYANRANLADSWWKDVIGKYEGTRYGEQEIHARVMDDVPGAMWRMALIEATRVQTGGPQITTGRVVMGVDPAVTSGASSNETGIIVVAAGTGVWKGHAFVMRDLSGRHAASKWPAVVKAAYDALSVDRVVAEVNNGGDLVESALRVADPNMSYLGVHAARGKRTRAEPIAALYEQGLVHHIGVFKALEDQMCTFIPDERQDLDAIAVSRQAGESGSPDRVDALVWALTDLLLGARVFLV